MSNLHLVAKPAKRCPATRKLRYRDHREAVRALHRITTIRHRDLESGVPSELVKRREVRDYRCPACGGHHLTSQP